MPKAVYGSTDVELQELPKETKPKPIPTPLVWIALYQAFLCAVLVLAVQSVHEWSYGLVADASWSHPSLSGAPGGVVDSITAALTRKGVPDVAVFHHPGTGVMWTWTHGVLYGAFPTAALHALSCTLMDPDFVVVQLTDWLVECSDPTGPQCLAAVVQAAGLNETTDDMIQSLSEGYFATTTADDDPVLFRVFVLKFCVEECVSEELHADALGCTHY